MKVELLDGFWSFCRAKGQKGFASSFFLAMTNAVIPIEAIAE
jgi:hypothetical protein